MKNYYNVLALAQNATREQIVKRFRELVRTRHPDRFQGEAKAKAEEEFQAITEAFNVLSNPERRRQHDLEIAKPPEIRQNPEQSDLSKVYLQRGIRAYKEQKYHEAAQNFDRATKAAPEDGRAWYYFALALSQDSRYQSKAANASAKACELKPMEARYLKLAGRLFEQAGLSGRAEHYYTETLKWGGEDPDVTARLERLRKDSKRGKSGLFG